MGETTTYELSGGAPLNLVDQALSYALDEAARQIAEDKSGKAVVTVTVQGLEASAAWRTKWGTLSAFGQYSFSGQKSGGVRYSVEF